jgi:hypothetical protein
MLSDMMFCRFFYLSIMGILDTDMKLPQTSTASMREYAVVIRST